MFQHILLPVDGSATATAAVEKAIAIAKAFGSVVTLICVIDPYPFTGVGTDFGYGQEQYLDAARADAATAITAAKAKLDAGGIVTRPRTVEAHAKRVGPCRYQHAGGEDIGHSINPVDSGAVLASPACNFVSRFGALAIEHYLLRERCCGQGPLFAGRHGAGV